MQFVNQVIRIIRRRLHGDHARRLFTGHIFDHALVHQRFNIANHQRIHHRLGIRLINVVPVRFQLRVGLTCYRNQLLQHRVLGHGVFELVMRQVEAIDAARFVGIQHDLDGTDQLDNRGGIAKVSGGGGDVAAKALEIAIALGTDQGQIDLQSGCIPFLHGGNNGFEQINVQATAKSTIGGNNDQADAPGLTLFQIGMVVFRMRKRHVRHHVLDLFRIGACRQHPFLCLAHFARRHHLHRLGDLLRALDARNLGADFFRACHYLTLWLVCTYKYIVGAALAANTVACSCCSRPRPILRDSIIVTSYPSP